MADTNIEWADAVWNPLAGCTRVSPGCQHCYAERMAKRLVAMGQKGYEGTVGKNGRWTGRVNLIPEKLWEPTKRKKPTTYFVNSMSDLFHESVPNAFIDRVFVAMVYAPQHRFIVLTKRAGRMREYMENAPVRPEPGGKGVLFKARDTTVPKLEEYPYVVIAKWPLPNVILGVSVEDQVRADERVPDLLATPAACRCISAEPLLGPVDIGPWLDPTGYACCGGNETCYGNGRCPVTNWPRGEDGELVTLDWVIAGGESGPNARPICREWLESVRDYCLEYEVPFFFKQWGEWTPGENVERITGTCESAFWFNEKWFFSKAYLAEDGHIDDEPDAYRIGKRAAGRLLDGVEWSQLPEVLKKVNA